MDRASVNTLARGHTAASHGSGQVVFLNELISVKIHFFSQCFLQPPNLSTALLLRRAVEDCCSSPSFSLHLPVLVLFQMSSIGFDVAVLTGQV